MIPRSLYIHIPWCIKKCPYCDFNSHKVQNEIPEQQYLQALVKDLQLHNSAKLTIHSIFIGGGTPSLISPKGYDWLFNELNKHLNFTHNLEITLEANPGTLDGLNFKDYRSLGINRLSLGVQSFNDTHLKKLGRIHNSKQAENAITCAQNAGFDNINLDLMYGLPNQSINEGLDDLKRAISFNPEHLSWYQLTLEPNTYFHKYPPKLPKEQIILDIEAKGLELLANNGFKRYEISAFAKGNLQAQHNLNYWLFGDYIGIGAGAHGKLTLDDYTIIRTEKFKQPSTYLNPEKNYLARKYEVACPDIIFEYMLNTTRLTSEIPYNLFSERTGLPNSLLKTMLNQAFELKFIEFLENSWKVTPYGRRFTNDLQALFLPD